MTKPIPSSHRALSSGQLAPGAGVPDPGVGPFAFLRRLMKAKGVLFVNGGERAGDRIVMTSPKGARPEVYVIGRKR